MNIWIGKQTLINNIFLSGATPLWSLCGKCLFMFFVVPNVGQCYWLAFSIISLYNNVTHAALRLSHRVRILSFFVFSCEISKKNLLQNLLKVNCLVSEKKIDPYWVCSRKYYYRWTFWKVLSESYTDDYDFYEGLLRHKLLLFVKSIIWRRRRR